MDAAIRAMTTSECIPFVWSSLPNSLSSRTLRATTSAHRDRSTSSQGLKPGDRWCLCASRWVEAWKAGKAPKVVLEATHERTLDFVELDELVKWAARTSVEK